MRVNQIYLPTTGSHDWRWLLAKSRAALEARRVGDGPRRRLGARATAGRSRWPRHWPPSDLTDLELLLALPEHKVAASRRCRLPRRPISSCSRGGRAARWS